MLGLSQRIKHASERLAETTVSGRVHYYPGKEVPHAAAY
jgi:hypothetical protein